MTPKELKTAIARLFEGQDVLAGKVAELTDDVAKLTDDVAELKGTVAELTGSVNIMREEAVADRKVQREAMHEVRGAVGAMLEIAGSMAANVTLLTQAQHGTTRRVSKLERRVDGLEKQPKSPRRTS
jgi:methyl-accepting chemotaxis protein